MPWSLQTSSWRYWHFPSLVSAAAVALTRTSVAALRSLAAEDRHFQLESFFLEWYGSKFTAQVKLLYKGLNQI